MNNVNYGIINIMNPFYKYIKVNMYINIKGV